MTARWRRITSCATALLGVVSVGVASAGIAEAKPKKPGDHEYTSCVETNLDGINKDHTKIPLDAYFQVLENCCTDLGGIYNENTARCYLPNGETGSVTPPTQRPVPGSVVVLPPDSALHPQ